MLMERDPCVLSHMYVVGVRRWMYKWVKEESDWTMWPVDKAIDEIMRLLSSPVLLFAASETVELMGFSDRITLHIGERHAPIPRERTWRYA